MTKSSSIQQTILFVGGLLLGVLIAITLVQNDTPNFLQNMFDRSQSSISETSSVSTSLAIKESQFPLRENQFSNTNNGNRNIANSVTMTSRNEEEESEATPTSDLNWMKPIIPQSDTSLTHASSPLLSDSVSIKWAPGMSTSIHHNSNTPPILGDKDLRLDGDISVEPIKPFSSESQATNRMIKRLRKRQNQLEKQGIDSSSILEKLSSLMSAKLEKEQLGSERIPITISNSHSSPAASQIHPTTAVQPAGHAEVADVSSALSLLDAAFDSPLAPASVTNTNKASKSNNIKSGTDKNTKLLTSTSGKNVNRWDKEAVVFGTPEPEQLQPLPDNLPIIEDAFPSDSAAILYSHQSQVPLPYHFQAQRAFEKYQPFVPTMENIQQLGLPKPDMRLQRATYEHTQMNLKLHLCNAVFEAYSASYLTTKAHILEIPSETYNLTWVNCEMASFIHMKESSKFYATPDASGIIIQSLDVLDFSVIHLSAFERSSKRYKDKLWSHEKDRRTQWHKIEEVKRTGVILQRLNDPKYAQDKKYLYHVEVLKNETTALGQGTTNSKKGSNKKKEVQNTERFNAKRFAPLSSRRVHYSSEANRTIVVMPFLGGAMGAGHSELGNRFEYLKTCFWSLYEFFPHIVAAVTRPEDVTWGMEMSGLPFYDMLLIENLPKSAGLPVGSMQKVKYLLQHDPEWSTSFDYVFFTESDQILISRELQAMYHHLKQYPRHMILPHRLMPYSADAMVKGLNRKDILGTKTTASAAPIESSWMNMSCCLPRQNCIERKTWKHLSDVSVPIINYYGLYVPLGNVNFLDEKYRACTLTPYIGSYCP